MFWLRRARIQPLTSANVNIDYDAVPEFAALATLILGVLFTVVSVIPRIREFALQVAGVMLIVSLALIAGNPWVYFGAVFIIATLVTSLDFLEKLAAIIRGSPEYFDYLKGVAKSSEPGISEAHQAYVDFLPDLGGDEQSGYEEKTATDPKLKELKAEFEPIVELINNEEQEEAIAKLEKLKSEKPNDPNILLLMAAAYRGLKKYYLAIDYTNLVIEFDPKREGAYLLQAISYLMLKKYDETVRTANLGLEVKPNSVGLIAYRAIAYERQGRYEDAIESANHALEISPGIPSMHSTRAVAYRNLGKFDEALKDAETALERSPDDITALGELGYIYRKRSMWDEVVDATSRRIELSPEDDWAYAIRADAYRNLGRVDDAVRDVARALELDPENEFAKWVSRKLK